jgi:hypothetical protein
MPLFAALLVLFLSTSAAIGESAGFLAKDGIRLFPLGFYELPSDDTALKRMAEAGVNLVHCHSRHDLDRASAAGIQGVFPLPVQEGATEKISALVESVKDHPALAVWEGPDEVVWNFTAASALHRTQGIYPTSDEWARQTPLALRYSEDQAAQILPKMREGIALVRKLDGGKHPVWINEALDSDVKFVRRYMDWIDITGCDIYPIKKQDRRVERLAAATERWKSIGRGKPVWMVLQAFSWNELGDYYGAKEPAYPSFAESRFMAYDVIARGASGLLYWGSTYLKEEDFRTSLYALVSELASLQPFLVTENAPGVSVEVIPSNAEEATGGVMCFARQSGDNWLVALVNEDDQRHMGVVVSGLSGLEGKALSLLYGSEAAVVVHDELVTRLQPHEVEVFATDLKYESTHREGRDFDE